MNPYRGASLVAAGVAFGLMLSADRTALFFGWLSASWSADWFSAVANAIAIVAAVLIAIGVHWLERLRDARGRKSAPREMAAREMTVIAECLKIAIERGRAAPLSEAHLAVLKARLAACPLALLPMTSARRLGREIELFVADLKPGRRLTEIQSRDLQVMIDRLRVFQVNAAAQIRLDLAADGVKQP